MGGAYPLCLRIGRAVGRVHALAWIAALGAAQAQTVALYSHKDAIQVRRFVAAYSIGRDQVQIDADMRPGDRWREVVALRIQQAETVLLFWSASAAASVEVGAEWRIAAALCRLPCRLVPVLLDDTPMPVERQGVDWR